MASSACHCRKPNSSADPRTLLPRQDGHVPLRRRLLRRIHAGGSPGQRRPVDAAGRPQRGPRGRIHLESLGARGWPVEFAWMDRIVERLARAQIRVIMGTPTYSIPPWMFKEHPEILVTRLDGQKATYGIRQNMDITNPDFLRY